MNTKDWDRDPKTVDRVIGEWSEETPLRSEPRAARPTAASTDLTVTGSASDALRAALERLVEWGTDANGVLSLDVSREGWERLFPIVEAARAALAATPPSAHWVCSNCGHDMVLK